MKKRNWDVALVDWERLMLGRHFEWGETDCVSVVLAALEVMYAEADRPKLTVPSWSTQIGALRAIKKVGNIPQALRDGGAQNVPLAFARPGDIVVGLEPSNGMPRCGVVVERHVVTASVKNGVFRFALRDLRREAPPDVEVLRFVDE